MRLLCLCVVREYLLLLHLVWLLLWLQGVGWQQLLWLLHVVLRRLLLLQGVL